jgi:uncharacterized protein YbjT (DUF2867 family)
MSNSTDSPRRVLVLGATGHLGRAAVARLLGRGYQVHGLARAPSPITRSMSAVVWHFADLASLTTEVAWKPIINTCDVVVNFAGALQDGIRDRLSAVHVIAIQALMDALPATSLVIHISAPGVSETSSTEFYRTKALGDDAVRRSRKPFVILRPAVVISADAYGGTALLRTLSVMPLFIPAISPESPMQTVGLEDVVDAVCLAVEGNIPNGSDLVLGEPHPKQLRDVILAFRQWYGLPPVPVVAVPRFFGWIVAKLADAAGHLGWRSPLRSTAMTVAAEGVTGKPQYPCKPLAEVLSMLPLTTQERWFARLYLLKAVGIIGLSLFWLSSGVIGLLQISSAMAVLTAAGFAASSAKAFVVAGAIADVVLGITVLVRRTMPVALAGMIVLTACYLAAATLFVPDLWLDPMGPLVKTLPAALLALTMLAIAPER